MPRTRKQIPTNLECSFLAKLVCLLNAIKEELTRLQDVVDQLVGMVLLGLLFHGL
jgi:hypothetical protein